MFKVSELLKSMTKEYGDKTILKACKLANCTRIPTGAFPFDLATGGGIPLNRVTHLYGMESSFKTNLGLMTIANMQRLHPDYHNVLVDIEGAYDKEWGAKLGVDNDRLIYVAPDYAEQAVDIIEGFLHAEDVGIVLLDSIAAMITANETTSSAEKAVVGGNTTVVNKLYRKATLALSKSRIEGRMSTLIAINQIRYKVGFVMGDPEVTPGGKAFPFGSSLSIRLNGKDEMDTKIHPDLPSWKLVNGTIRKRKVPVVAKKFEIKFATVDSELMLAGQTEIWAPVSAHLKNLGFLYKADDGSWVCLGESYRILKEVKERMREDIEFADLAKNTVIAGIPAEVEAPAVVIGEDE